MKFLESIKTKTGEVKFYDASLIEVINRYGKSYLFDLTLDSNPQHIDGSTMNDIMWSRPNCKKKTRTIFGILGRDIICWAWYRHSSCFSPPTHRAILTYFFVKEQFRRLGFGTKLNELVRKICKNRKRKYTADPWDERSESFFGNFIVTIV